MSLVEGSKCGNGIFFQTSSKSLIDALKEYWDYLILSPKDNPNFMKKVISWVAIGLVAVGNNFKKQLFILNSFSILKLYKYVLSIIQVL